MTEAASREWFDRVYTETLPDVRRIAYAILRFYPDLKGEADDLIQETYLRMYRAREQLYDRQEIIKWLVVTLKNLTSNRLRVRKTYIKHNIVNADKETLLEFCSSNQYENVDHAFIDEDQERLNKIAEQLGADKLELLSEYYLDKVPLSELAERENISTNAMKMRISRLRKKCVEILVAVLLLNMLLLKGYIYIRGEGHGNQYQQAILFRAGCAETADGRNEQNGRSDGYHINPGVLMLPISGKRRRRPRIH